MESDASATGEPNENGAPSGQVYDWYVRGIELLQRGDAAAAAQLLARAAAAEPDSRNVREALARALFDSRRYSEAAQNFGRIVAESPTDDYARYGLGLSLTRLGDFHGAIEHLALAVAMRPEVKHYANALKGARATIRAREELA